MPSGLFVFWGTLNACMRKNRVKCATISRREGFHVAKFNLLTFYHS
jgi:hypothetical protein